MVCNEQMLLVEKGGIADRSSKLAWRHKLGAAVRQREWLRKLIQKSSLAESACNLSHHLCLYFSTLQKISGCSE
jgi:hypothetical protein